MVATVGPTACPGRFTRLTAAGSNPSAASCTRWSPIAKGSAGRTAGPQPLHLRPDLEPNRGELHQLEPNREGRRRQDRQGINRSGREPAPGRAPARWLAGSTKPPTPDPVPLPMVATVAPTACPGRFTQLTAAGSIPSAASCTKWSPTTKGSAGRIGRAQPLHLHPDLEPNRGELHRVEPDHEGPGRQDRQGLNRSGWELARAWLRLAGWLHQAADARTLADSGHGCADRVPWEIHPTDGRRLEPERGELHQVEPDHEEQGRQDRQGLNRSTFPRTSIPTAASCTKWSPTTKGRAAALPFGPPWFPGKRRPKKKPARGGLRVVVLR